MELKCDLFLPFLPLLFSLWSSSWFYGVQDALRLPVCPLISDREGQDVGLPLLHVLGKQQQAALSESVTHCVREEGGGGGD